MEQSLNQTIRNRNNQNVKVADVNYLKVKYNCRFCNQNYLKYLHSSIFMQSCFKCQRFSQLLKLKCSFSTLYGEYKCSFSKCLAEWMQKLPFKGIIVNTPCCFTCKKLTKIRVINYRHSCMLINNTCLYKCSNCSKCLSTKKPFSIKRELPSIENSKFEVENNKLSKGPYCDNCNIPMYFLKNLKSIFLKKKNKIPGTTEKQRKPTGRIQRKDNLRKNFSSKLKKTKNLKEKKNLKIKI